MTNSIADNSSNRIIDGLHLSELPLHFGNYDGGELVVVESKTHVPFGIERIFTLRAPIGTVRGGHAHRRCTQFMICPLGMIEVNCDDGQQRKSLYLDRGNVGLLVPPNIWTTQSFGYDNSLLLVVCDKHYEESDYIRDYAEFLACRNTQ
jgi:hypothetical protein